MTEARPEQRNLDSYFTHASELLGVSTKQAEVSLIETDVSSPQPSLHYITPTSLSPYNINYIITDGSFITIPGSEQPTFFQNLSRKKQTVSFSITKVLYNKHWHEWTEFIHLHRDKIAQLNFQKTTDSNLDPYKFDEQNIFRLSMDEMETVALIFNIYSSHQGKLSLADGCSYMGVKWSLDEPEKGKIK